MQRSRHFAPVLFVGLFVCAAGCTGETAETDGATEAAEEAGMLVQDEAAVRELTTSFDLAVNAENIDAMLARYAPGAVRMNPNVPAAAGLDAIRESFATVWQTSDNRVQNEVADVRISGDLAVVRGTYRVTVMPTNGEQPYDDSGKWMAAVERQADGTWKSVWEIWNSDLPPRPVQ